VLNGAFVGSPFGSAGWFCVLTASRSPAGYLALGYAYTKWKATGELRAHAGRRGVTLRPGPAWTPVPTPGW